MTDSLIESMARAMAIYDFDSVPRSAQAELREAWIEDQTRFYLPRAAAAWAAAAEPTEAMLEAGHEIAACPLSTREIVEHGWQAMHGAADDHPAR